MIQIALSESHKETDTFYFRNIFSQRFNLFVMKQIHIFHTYLIKIIFPFNRHRRDLDPVTVLPITSRGRNFTKINLRIKVCGKSITVITAVTVKNINRVNGIKLMLLRISTVSLSYTRIKSGTEKCHKTGFFKFFLICPLPGVVKIS